MTNWQVGKLLPVHIVRWLTESVKFQEHLKGPTHQKAIGLGPTSTHDDTTHAIQLEDGTVSVASHATPLITYLLEIETMSLLYLWSCIQSEV